MQENAVNREEMNMGVPRNGLDHVKLENVPVDRVEAESVVVHNSLVQHVSATAAELVQSGVLQLDSDQIEINQGGVGFAQAGSLEVHQGGVGITQADNMAVEGVVGVGISDQFKLEGGQAGLLLANEVHTTGSRTILLLAGNIDGPVEAVLDTPRTVLAGLVAGVGVGLVLLVGNLLTRRRSS